MAPTLNVYKAWPEGYGAWKQLSDQIYESGLEPSLINLVMIRASQINRCALCLEMHAREARQAGEEQRRLDTVAAWRDARWYTDKERAALALTEAVTETRGTEEAVEEARRHFDDAEFAKLLLAIVVINGWNRINGTMGYAPVPSHH